MKRRSICSPLYLALVISSNLLLSYTLQAQCETISADRNTFCGSGSTKTLSATTTSGACSNLEWYAGAASTTLLQTGCEFTTPGLTNDVSYYVNDPSDDGNIEVINTGFDYNSSDLSNPVNAWVDGFKTTLPLIQT